MGLTGHSFLEKVACLFYGSARQLCLVPGRDFAQGLTVFLLAFIVLVRIVIVALIALLVRGDLVERSDRNGVLTHTKHLEANDFSDISVGEQRVGTVSQSV